MNDWIKNLQVKHILIKRSQAKNLQAPTKKTTQTQKTSLKPQLEILLKTKNSKLKIARPIRTHIE